MSRNALRGLIPGVCDLEALALDVAVVDEEEEEEEEEAGEGEGDDFASNADSAAASPFAAVVAVGSDLIDSTASRRTDSILSLYASLSDSIESWPSLRETLSIFLPNTYVYQHLKK